MINKKMLREVFFFGLVGGGATLTHYIVALFVVEFLNLAVYIGNLSGYLAAVSVSYFGHGLLTFQKTLNRANLIRFIVGSVATFLASQGLLIFLEEALILHHRISFAIIVVSIPLLSFVINKLWVYRDPQAS